MQNFWFLVIFLLFHRYFGFNCFLHRLCNCSIVSVFVFSYFQLLLWGLYFTLRYLYMSLSEVVYSIAWCHSAKSLPFYNFLTVSPSFFSKSLSLGNPENIESRDVSLTKKLKIQILDNFDHLHPLYCNHLSFYFGLILILIGTYPEHAPVSFPWN